MNTKSGGRTLVTAVALNEMAWLSLIGCYLWFDTKCRDYEKRLAAFSTAAVEAPAQPLSSRVSDVLTVRDRELNQELVGLRGSLKSVVFVIDRSGSMNRGGRWATVRSIVRTWLERLPIERAALVIFNETVAVFPSTGGFLDLSGSNAEHNRGILLAAFDRVSPQGHTNTVEALRSAFGYENAGSIFLFSDGAPDAGKNRFDRVMAAQVIALCRQHGKGTPVNTIGLGDYLNDREMGRFLVRVAAETGGTFIGR
jgi:hypothetical protein